MVCHESRMWNFKKDVFELGVFPPERGVKQIDSKYEDTDIPLGSKV